MAPWAGSDKRRPDLSPMPATGGHRGERRWRVAFLIAGLIILIAGLIILIVSANLGSAWLFEMLDFELTPRNEQVFHRIVMITVIVYALLIAIPFVPGIEIGLALMIIVGPGIAALVYGATVFGLLLSFLIGHFVPQAWLKSIFEYFHLAKASRLIGQLEDLGIEERLAFLVSRTPGRIIPPLFRYRYIVLALVLNIPGNSLIGGGGGISMMAGLSRLYSVPAFLVTLALAVSPVPLAVFIFGREVLSR